MSQLRFSGAHVWVRIDDDFAVLGLSDYLQDQMGEITTLDLVNAEPYGSGWLVKVRLEDRGELEDLISEEEYAELTTEV